MSRAELRGVYAERDRAARAFKAGGGQVVGYVGPAPEALIAAAALLPYRLSGDPEAGDAALRRRLYPLFNKAQAVRGLIAREQPNTILERLFDGGFDFVDHLLIVAGRKDVAQLLTHLRNAASADPDLPLPSVHFVDRVPAGGFAGSQYNRESLRLLTPVLEGWAGRPITDESLHAAISDFNMDHAVVTQLAQARAAGLWSGRDALAALGAGWLMPGAEHARLLHAALAEAADGARGVRLAVLGSSLDHDHVHAVVETLGAVVVFDGHDWGEAGLAPAIALDLPPFEAVVEQFNAAPEAAAAPLALSAARLAAQARAAGAAGVVVLAHRGDTLAAFDAPDLLAACEAAGLPTLYLAEQPFRPDPDALRATLAPFIARLAPSGEDR